MNTSPSPTLQMQRPLELPASESDLLRAYHRCGLKHYGIDFETAKTDPAIRIPLTNLARALNKRQPRFKWGRK